MECCIVIPLYKSQPSEQELASLKQAVLILGSRPFYVVCPVSLDITLYEPILNEPNLKWIRLSFDDYFFSSIEGYNRLLLSRPFYEKFRRHSYLFLYQLDAWIFKDDLSYWCSKGYDYVGAPWVDWEWSEFYARHLTFPRRLLYRLGKRGFNYVGNGGLSLRKVSSFVRNLSYFANAAQKFEKNEDFFFSYYINSFNPFFKVAPFREALSFAFDENPEKAFLLNKERLPMGCHAWPKHYDNFWKKYISLDQLVK